MQRPPSISTHGFPSGRAPIRSRLVPARAEFLHVVRTVVGSVAARSQPHGRRDRGPPDRGRTRRARSCSSRKGSSITVRIVAHPDRVDVDLQHRRRRRDVAPGGHPAHARGAGAPGSGRRRVHGSATARGLPCASPSAASRSQHVTRPLEDVADTELFGRLPDEAARRGAAGSPPPARRCTSRGSSRAAARASRTSSRSRPSRC